MLEKILETQEKMANFVVSNKCGQLIAFVFKKWFK